MLADLVVVFLVVAYFLVNSRVSKPQTENLMSIEVEQRQVRKRDGQTIQMFDTSKVAAAIRGAWNEVGGVDEKRIETVARNVMSSVPGNEVVDIEHIQNLVEYELMRNQLFDVGKAYMLYRAKRSEMRSARRHPDPLAVSDYIHAGKYARYRESDRRREVYAETVARDEDMHLRKFGHIPGMRERINKAFKFVYEKKLLPSMRSMQFGGKAIEVVNNRIYNCSATHIDRLDAFSQGFYLLLCGCGVGYSVQFEHVDKLPEFSRVDESKVVHHVIQDSIEGWADAVLALLRSYVDGTYIEFAYHLIRAEGMVLKTSGGKAPGHVALKQALELVRGILDGAQGRRLRPVEAHRIMCHLADAVLSGGIRRSAMICLFSLEDSEMMYLKTGDWHSREPYLENANNSVVLKRDDVKHTQFMRVFQMTKQFGEPGFIFVADKDEVRNPCAEIALNCKLTINYEVMKILKDRAKRGKSMPDVKMGEVYTGYAFCNLTEINAAKLKSREDFIAVGEAAALIGTLQAAYTDMPYLGWVSEVIAEREALLGVGMTGIMDSPEIALDADMQRDVASRIVEWNGEFAEMIGIRPAARTTTVKPSGTTALELGSVGSGIHAHHARRYIRSVTANKIEAVFNHFRATNPHMCVMKPNGDFVIEFPVTAPEGAIVKSDLGAIEFMNMVMSTQQNWVNTGTARPESSPGYTHNVSNTIHVKPSEWDAVAAHLWEHRALFSGVSFIPVDDTVYPFAPFQAIITEADESRWNQLLAHYKPVDYTALIENEDATDVGQEPACAGGSCEIPVR